VERVILSHGVSPNRSRQAKRKLKKITQIGLLGALNGIRMRKWYRHKEVADLAILSKSHGIPFFETEFTNSDLTRELFRDANADLGLSLGNGFIPPSVFTIPKLGMINIHTEILPQFQGAQGVIWSLHEGLAETGFTIHQISRRIDGGDILMQEKVPIIARKTIQQTVEDTMDDIRKRLPRSICEVCARYEYYKVNSKSQDETKSFTTPNLVQFLRMRRNNRQLYLAKQIQ
jgi:methionyl-tRNA formyltransferase